MKDVLKQTVPWLATIGALSLGATVMPPPVRASGETCTVTSPSGISCSIGSSGLNGAVRWFVFHAEGFASEGPAFTVIFDDGSNDWTVSAPSGTTEGCEAAASGTGCDAACTCAASSCECSSHTNFAMCIWWNWNGTNWELDGYGEGC